MFKDVSFPLFLLPVLTVQVIKFLLSFPRKSIMYRNIRPHRGGLFFQKKKMLLDHETPNIDLINSSSLIFFINMTPELSHDDTDEHTYEGAFNSDEPPYGYPFSTFFFRRSF